MAVVFVFKVSSQAEADCIFLDIKSRGDFKFLYKCTGAVGRMQWMYIYNLESLNDALIDVLHQEFQSLMQYRKYIRLTNEFMDDIRNIKVLFLRPEEVNAIRALNTV